MDEPNAITDRQGLEILDYDECWRLLSATPIGRIAFVEAGEPLILPVTHVVVNHTIAFLTASGSKLGAAMMAEPVGFEVDGYDVDAQEGWSVVVRGVVEPVYEEVLLSRLDRSGHRPWARGVERPHWVQIKPSEVTGRRLAQG